MDARGPHADHGVYGISTAAELVGLAPQTLRLYEARGLLEPTRTAGGTRRYSANDLDRLRHIAELVDAGVNLAGIGMVLELEGHNAQLQAQVDSATGQPTGSEDPVSASVRSPVAPARTPRRPSSTT